MGHFWVVIYQFGNDNQIVDLRRDFIHCINFNLKSAVSFGVDQANEAWCNLTILLHDCVVDTSTVVRFTPFVAQAVSESIDD